MDTNSQLAVSPAVEHKDGVFHLSWPGGEMQVVSPLAQFEPPTYEYEAFAFVREGLAENYIRQIQSQGKNGRRLGWMIPANALSSTNHDFAEDKHFLPYAHAAIDFVLRNRYDDYRDSLQYHFEAGHGRVTLSELFHDNVCFFVVCTEMLSDFDLSRFVPGLTIYGFIPLSAVDPASIGWKPIEKDDGSGVLRIPQVASLFKDAELPGTLLTTAASFQGSNVTQFFYAYQVVELLMETAMESILEGIAVDITSHLQNGNVMQLRDSISGLNTKIGEKNRLKRVIGASPGTSGLFEELESLSSDFLALVGYPVAKESIKFYGVRNFIVHQVRNMPKEAEVALAAVSQELLRILPKILSHFSLEVWGSGEAEVPDMAPVN